MKFKLEKDIYFVLKVLFALGVILTSLTQLVTYGAADFSHSILGNVSLLFLAFEFTVMGVERQKKYKDRIGQVFTLVAMFLVFWAVGELTRLLS